MGRNNKSNMYVDCIPLHDEVTGSCIYCNVRFPNKENVKFIVDCGLFQEEKYQEKNYSFPFNPEEIDFALITHNHIDHIGRLPKLYKDGFRGKTYASKITSELMPYALENTAEILSINTQRNRQAKKKIIADASFPVYYNELKKPLYLLEDVEYTMQNVIGKEYNQSFEICKHIAATFIPNNHLLGASCILITITYKGEKPIYLLFTGDYSKNNIFLEEPNMPKYLKNVPLNIVQEATYGNTSSKNITKVFKDNLLQSIKNSETFIAPVFSLGRAQEILFELKEMQNLNLLSSSIPIYLDGKLAQSYTEFYIRNPEYITKKDFLPDNLTLVQDYETREFLLRDRNCKIILTTSGMGSYGPAQLYLSRYISCPKCTIHFCGYTTENTLGRRLQSISKDEEFKINGICKVKKANVLSTNEFSGHAKVEELLDFLKQFNNIKSILINHADENAKVEYEKRVINEINPKAITILRPTNCIRIGAYGIIKSYKV